MRIYCSGIGGIGLSAYAALQAQAGHSVSGSDRSESALLQDLRSQGIEIFLQQDGSHVPGTLDLFVYSEAIPADAPERVRARERNVRSISYFEALGEMSKDCTVIAICGTHGKSSTTAMVARMLIECGKDPTVVVGTKVRELDGRNWRKGESNLFVLEACEYRRSFHHLSPDIILITNVDGDHFDAYKDIGEYQQAFVEFCEKLPSDGTVIVHGRDADSLKVATESHKNMIDADTYPLISLQTPGLHMQQNAQLALALADVLHIARETAASSLNGFAGTWRRMEVKGETAQGVTVIDDYGHHPVEIRATIHAIKGAYPGRRIVCVYQPHTHHRTLALYEDFTKAFADANLVILSSVYDARHDIERETVNEKKFLADIAAASQIDARLGGSVQHTEELLRTEILRPLDVLLVLGAGDVTDLAAAMVQEDYFTASTPL